MNRMRRIGVLLMLFLVVPVLATTLELPDSETNPHTGNIESVDAPMGNGHFVRHVVDGGRGGARFATTISDHAASGPRIAIRDDGETWVAWWRDASVDGIYVRTFDTSSETWGPQKSISLPNENSRYPDIVHADGTTWIAYAIDTGAGTSLATLSIIDSGDPWPTRSIVATTSATDDVDVRVHTDSIDNQPVVWITWMDDANELGWVAYDPDDANWSSTRYQAHYGAIDKALEEIHADVVGMLD